MDEKSEAALRGVREAFGGVPRPEHFTNHTHCCECAEHDETLRAHTPGAISPNELGNPGRDPVCFVSLQGYKYYMPAFARLALGEGKEYYLDQFVFHLNQDRIQSFNKAQCRAMIGFVKHLLERLDGQLLDGTLASYRDYEDLEQRLQWLETREAMLPG